MKYTPAKQSTQCLIIAGILMISCFFPVYGRPENTRVKEELNRLLEELGTAGTRDDDPVDNPVLEFLNNLINDVLSVIFKFGSRLVIPVVILFVFISGYFGLKFFSHFRREKDKSGQLTSGGDIHEKAGSGVLSHYIKNAEDLAEAGRYGDALVFLHKASIVFLRLKKISTSGEYHTNDEIRKDLLSMKQLYDPFSNLARIAERTTFRYEKISEETYKELLKEFKNNFIVNGK